MVGNSVTLNIRPKWPDVPNDYLAWYEGREVGRIRLALEAEKPGTVWEWYITVPMAVPEWGRGVADGRDAAIKDFSSALGRLLRETSREQLQRVWEFERAAQARLPGKS
jgi:hypothetical protein